MAGNPYSDKYANKIPPADPGLAVPANPKKQALFGSEGD
jgi:hypothetical protein